MALFTDLIKGSTPKKLPTARIDPRIKEVAEGVLIDGLIVEVPGVILTLMLGGLAAGGPVGAVAVGGLAFGVAGGSRMAYLQQKASKRRQLDAVEDVISDVEDHAEHTIRVCNAIQSKDETSKDAVMRSIIQEDVRLLYSALSLPPDERHAVLKHMAIFNVETDSSIEERHYGRQRVVDNAQFTALIERLENYCLLLFPEVDKYLQHDLEKGVFSGEEKKALEDKRQWRHETLSAALDDREKRGLVTKEAAEKEREQGIKPRMPLEQRELLIARQKERLLHQEMPEHLSANITEAVDWRQIEAVTTQYEEVMRSYIRDFELFTTRTGNTVNNRNMVSSYLEFNRILGNTDAVVDFLTKMITNDLQQTDANAARRQTRREFRPPYEMLHDVIGDIWNLPHLDTFKNPDKYPDQEAIRGKMHALLDPKCKDILTPVRRMAQGYVSTMDTPDPYALRRQEMGSTEAQIERIRKTADVVANFMEATLVLFNSPFSATLQAATRRNSFEELTDNGRYLPNSTAFNEQMVDDYNTPSMYVRGYKGSPAQPATIRETVDIMDNVATFMQHAVGKNAECWNKRQSEMFALETQDDMQAGSWRRGHKEQKDLPDYVPQVHR